MPVSNVWTEVFTDSFNHLWIGVIDVVPKIILAILIFVIGWLIATLLEHGVERLIKALKVDSLLAHTGLDELVHKAGYKLDTGRFIGVIVRWFFIILFLIIALNIVNLTEVTLFLNEVLLYLPRVVVALIVLFVGSILANAMGKVAEASSRAAGIEERHMLAKVTRWMIWIFVVFVALTELRIGSQVITPLIYGIVGMLALAGGIAFGYGGRDAAGKFIDETFYHKKSSSRKKVK
jgi:hypothetical protein